jgi:hypothetical protein
MIERRFIRCLHNLPIVLVQIANKMGKEKNPRKRPWRPIAL